jgi:RNA polymerase sigma-70 factor (ECF subfamily)
MGPLEAAFRREKGRIVAGLMRMLASLEEAEDCFSEAVEKALQVWPERGQPDQPGAWLTTVARRKALDLLRRLKRAEQLQAEQPFQEEDDRLSLLFTCCHPALGWEARVALTLRTLGGLTTGEIARAFLVPETTMAQRIVRAQRKIRDAGIPYQVPPPELWLERLEGVLATVYFIFNEGYYTGQGEQLVREDLTREAILLGELLSELMPREAEPLGLLALMLLQHSRSPARLGGRGQALTLEEQNRSLWDRQLAQRGYECLDKAMRLGHPGPYQIQGAIAAMHCLARRSEETDWAKILALYDSLLQIDDSPVVRLNRGVALAMSGAPERALELVQSLPLEHYPLYHATLAELQKRLGRPWQASLQQALRLETNLAARKSLILRLEEPPRPFGTGGDERLAIPDSANPDPDSHHRHSDQPL